MSEKTTLVDKIFTQLKEQPLSCFPSGVCLNSDSVIQIYGCEL
jgi:hypothetical protein